MKPERAGLYKAIDFKVQKRFAESACYLLAARLDQEHCKLKFNECISMCVRNFDTGSFAPDQNGRRLRYLCDCISARNRAIEFECGFVGFAVCLRCCGHVWRVSSEAFRTKVPSKRVFWVRNWQSKVRIVYSTERLDASICSKAVCLAHSAILDSGSWTVGRHTVLLVIWWFVWLYWSHKLALHLDYLPNLLVILQRALSGIDKPFQAESFE